MVTYRTRAIILAAGRSTRFKTKKSKLLFYISGRAMIAYPLKVFEELGIPSTVVLGYQADDIRREIETAVKDNVSFVIQEEQRGTGHAVACSQPTWDQEHILIMNGDMPLLPKELVVEALHKHHNTGATITFLTTMMIDPTGYGRVIEDGHVIKIVEEKDCTQDERQISRVNAGVYIFKRDFLEQHIGQIEPSSVTGEIYLVDLIKQASEQGLFVNPISVPFDSVRGVNTLQELWTVDQIKRSEFIRHWMSQGVRFELAQTVHIDHDVKIGAGSFIGTGVLLTGKTTIGENTFIGAFTIVEDSTIGDDACIHSHNVIQNSSLGDEVVVGPFARIRRNADLSAGVEVGNFVEIKNAKIGQDSCMKHLSYIGDAELGSSVNVGAGTVTCNYDGVQKHKTTIKNQAFIGSNNTIVAPCTIGQNAYTAAGSTITEDVPEGCLAIGRSRQVNKEGYVAKLKARIKAACMGMLSKSSKKSKMEGQGLNYCGMVKSKKDEPQDNNVP